MATKTALLVGGTRDGELVEISSLQRVVYLPKRISIEENKALQIDDSTMWKPPEEVYERDGNGLFQYARTINWKNAI